MRLKTSGKIVVFILILGIALGAYKLYSGKSLGDIVGGLVPGKKDTASMVPLKADIPQAGSTDTTLAVKDLRMPGTNLGASDKPEVRMLVWAWNAQMGLMFANGGVQATQGSLMADHGVNLKLVRQDDSSKMQEALVAFAQELSQGNANPTKGAHFVSIMGDGSATFLKGVNDTLKKLGSEYEARVIATIGYSRGEDKLMGPKAWKQNPMASRGSLVAGVIRDGDWNIAQKWLGDNGIRNNPNEKTWDPDAMNWVNASDYVDAGTKYISGYSEDRAVVQYGKKTGQTKHVTVQGVVTWTPADVTVAHEKGGIINIVSTKEYSSQMPDTIIGIDKWMKDNRQEVEGMLQAIYEGGDAVRKSSDALQKAGDVSQAVYQEKGQDGDYWVKYYKGVTENDKQGMTVDLGGSFACNLGDGLVSFGMIPGAANLFAATYTTFGNIVVQQYPDLVPSILPVPEILDTSYLRDLQKQLPAEVKQTTPAAPKFTNTPITKAHIVSRKAWNIHFDTGKATFSPDTRGELERLRRDLLVASGTAVEIHGHTDNQGSPASNMSLSESRAFAVSHWLEQAFPYNFPKGRIRVFSHGSENPVAPNSSAQGRAQNRRVEVVLGTAE